MELAIGTKNYRFAVAPGPLNVGGRRVASVVDHNRREIRIDGTLPAELRPEIVALAVCEAWQAETVQRPPLRFVGDVG
jgi:hypothetical protein